MLRWRLLFGAAFIAALVALLWIDGAASTPGLVLLPLAFVLTILASEELLSLMAARNVRPVAPIVYLGNVLIVLSGYAEVWGAVPLSNLGWPMATFGLAILALFVGEMRRYEQPGATLEPLAGGTLALSYVGVLFSFVVQMRLLGPNGDWGIAAVASLVIVVKMGDTGAYTIGRLIGRHKLTPKLSPGKTIEGALGGLAFSVVGAWFCATFLVPKLTAATTSAPPRALWGWAGYGIVVGLAGILGDLAESLLKRDAGRKDSSTWMPGFGGVLDMLDSVLLAAPVAYLFWRFEIVRP
jgi:phosphatidate cytidylyltransferase